MTRHERRICYLIIIGCLAVLLWLAHLDWCASQTITMPVEHYTLDTGAVVLTWLDERRGVQCWAIVDTGLTCIPLSASVYNWPILESAP